MSRQFSPDNIGIVLHHARHAANIGSVCRVMKNLGFRNLHLVNPTEYGHLAAVRMFRGSEDILESAGVHASLDEAVSPYHYTFATSHRTCKDEAIAGAEKIARLALENRVAVVFGSEKYGLPREEVLKADGIISLPSESDFPSLNLSHAVGMLAMQIRLATEKRVPSEPAPERANLPKGERERFYRRMTSLFALAGFDTPSIEGKIRKLFDRTNLTEQEYNLFLGLAKELQKRLGEKE
jgi:TrmH family RNA methyltransferase